MNKNIFNSATKTLRCICLLVVAGLFAGAWSQAAAQSWPSKPVHLIVGFAPGGGTDIVARALSVPMTAALGQSIIVENKAGAAGTIAADNVAKSAPDGYTLLMGHSNSNAISPFVLKNIPVSSLNTELGGLEKEKVEQYKNMDFTKAPPIVIGDGHILDGYHRANAAKALGITTIKAYVGVKGNSNVAEGNAFLGALNTARKNNLEYFIVDGKKYKVKKNKKVVKEEELTEKWSTKYKRSIDCSHPKGFSQKAHCAGRRKKK